MRSNRALILILVVFAILSATYSCVTRLKYGPDEPAHFIYVRSIADRLALPPISHEVTPTEESVATHEGHQPPLYYALLAFPYAMLSALGASNEAIWRALRLVNIPLGLLWVCAVYALAFEFFQDRKRALTTAAFVALIPTSSYTAGVINNENLIAPLVTWSLIPMLSYFRTGSMSRRSAVWLGLLVGLSILTKAQGLVLIVMLLIASVAVLRRAGYRNWKQVLAGFATVIGVAAVVSGWWFARNYGVYGEPLPQSLYKPIFPNGLADVLAAPGQALSAAYFASCLTYGHFWIPYWLVQPHVPFLSYFYPLSVLTAIVVTGFAARVLRNHDLDRRSLAFLLAAPVFVYLLWLRHALFVDAGANMQGRLFLCVAGIVGIVWVLGIEGLARSQSARSVVFAAFFALLLAVNAAVIAGAAALYSH